MKNQFMAWISDPKITCSSDPRLNYIAKWRLAKSKARDPLFAGFPEK